MDLDLLLDFELLLLTFDLVGGRPLGFGGVLGILLTTVISLKAEFLSVFSEFLSVDLSHVTLWLTHVPVSMFVYTWWFFSFCAK